MDLFLSTVDYCDRYTWRRNQTYYLVKVVDGVIKSVVLADRTTQSPWCFNELFSLDRSTLDSALRFNRKQGRIACLYRAGYRILDDGPNEYLKISRHPNNRATLICSDIKLENIKLENIPTLVELCLRRCPRSQLNRSIIRMFDYFRSCPYCGDFYHPDRKDYCCRFQHRRRKVIVDAESSSAELLKFYEKHNISEIAPSHPYPDLTILPLIDPPRFVY